MKQLLAGSQTMVFDTGSFTSALTVLQDTFLGTGRWRPTSALQQRYLRLHYGHLDDVRRLNDVEAVASNVWTVIRDFLVRNRMDPTLINKFEPGEEVAAASIIDKTVIWPSGEAKLCQIGGMDDKMHDGIFLPPGDIEAYWVTVPAEGILVRFASSTKNTLWGFLPDWQNPFVFAHELDLVEFAFDLMSQRPASPFEVEGAQVPLVAIDQQPDVSWMLNMDMNASTGHWFVSQAAQQIKFRLTPKGARGKVAAVVGAKRGGPMTVTFDHPFGMWFTQNGIDDLPIMPMRIDYGAWKFDGEIDEM